MLTSPYIFAVLPASKVKPLLPEAGVRLTFEFKVITSEPSGKKPPLVVDESTDITKFAENAGKTIDSKSSKSNLLIKSDFKEITSLSF